MDIFFVVWVVLIYLGLKDKIVCGIGGGGRKFDIYGLLVFGYIDIFNSSCIIFDERYWNIYN